MSIYEASITNPKKQLEFYKVLSEQLQQENQQLKQIEQEHQKINGELREEVKQLEKRNKEIYDGFIATTQELTEYANAIGEIKKIIERV